uniref:cDNA FLJ42897 fis, clone BRHIP3009099 n=1 Tax=Homo sapiens TaxID=9606 RepID=Q6ZV82_HUMAN|nr:unnamed protein product [Homo sapiens]
MHGALFRLHGQAGHRQRRPPALTCLCGLTREGADRVLSAEVKALHEAILGATEQHVGFGGVEADFVYRALVFCEQLVLLVAGWPAQVPRDHHAIGGCCGQQVLIHLVPDHVSTAQVKRRLAPHTQVQLFHELFLLDGIDLEDATACHDHLGCVAAHTDGIGGSIQVAVHGAACQHAATQGCGHTGHLLHGCTGDEVRGQEVSEVGWPGQPGWVISSDLPPRLGPQNCLVPGWSVLVSQSRAVYQPISLTGKLKFTGVCQSSPSPWLSGEGTS